MHLTETRGTMYDEHNPIPMEKLEGMLADIRDMFPVPERGSDLEVAWAGAMASAEYVAPYVQMWMDKINVERILTDEFVDDYSIDDVVFNPLREYLASLPKIDV